MTNNWKKLWHKIQKPWAITKKFMRHLFTVLIFIFLLPNAYSQETEKTTRVLFVFDASLSMFGRFDGQPKIDVAQKVMSETLDSLKNIPNLQLALRMYGNRTKITNTFQDCEDTHLEVPFDDDNIEDIKHQLKSTVPKGTTPIAKSLEETINDFPPCANCRNIIILITDGIEACDGDPCAVAKALRTHNIYLKPFVIGLGVLEEYREHFYCIGSYFDANNKSEFKDVLEMVLKEALNTTSVQIDLLDINGNPSETNVGMTLYDHNTGEVKYNYVHTINYNGNPDTLSIDPKTTYDITIHTIPEVKSENHKLTLGKHNTIPIETPQGKLAFNVKGGNQQLSDVQAVIYPHNSCEKIHQQNLNEEVKYLVGSYDLEVLTLPPISATVEVEQSKSTKFVVPQPGKLNLKSNYTGYGAIYQNIDGEIKLIKNLTTEDKSQNYTMLPGDYKIIFRSINGNRSIYTVEKDFTIISGKSTLLNL